jgi:two-component system sensor histidine kinase KdpD
MPAIRATAVRQLAVRVLLGVAADALLSAACYGLQLNLATASLVLLLSVVAQALSATFLSAVIASFIAAGFLNYFFVPPVLTWRVASPFDLVALVAFITTAVTITRLATRACEEALKAERRRQSLEQLCQCGERLLTLDPENGVIPGLLRTYLDIFHLKAVCFFEGESATTFREGDADLLALRTRDAYFSGADADDLDHQIAIRCMRTGGRVTGVIGFEELRDPQLTARSLVTMAIAALDRAQAFREASLAVAASRTEALRAVVLDALAHELKTPLATILTAAGALHETVVTTEQQNLAEEIEAEAVHLSELTSTLLRKAEMESEQIEARMNRVDLLVLTRAIVARYSRQHGDRQISLKTSGVESAPVVADDDLLLLAIGQLMDNAVKYSDPASAVTVTLECNDQCVSVRVWNGGSFVHVNDRPRIFERFYRGAATQHAVAGSGLGLYVARRIARTHRGTLSLEDGTPDGVAFRLVLPICETEKSNGEHINELVGSR